MGVGLPEAVPGGTVGGERFAGLADSGADVTVGERDAGQTGPGRALEKGRSAGKGLHDHRFCLALLGHDPATKGWVQERWRDLARELLQLANRAAHDDAASADADRALWIARQFRSFGSPRPDYPAAGRGPQGGGGLRVGGVTVTPVGLAVAVVIGVVVLCFVASFLMAAAVACQPIGGFYTV